VPPQGGAPSAAEQPGTSATPGAVLTADRLALRVAAEALPPDGVLDVRWAGRRVWSTSVGHGRVVDGQAVFAWPAALAAQARGAGRISVHPHADDAELASGEVAFDDSGEPLSVQDALGRPLAVNKWGDLRPTFEHNGVDPHVLEAAADVLRVLGEHGLDGFITYGTLLGAKRSGQVIGHDDDLDLGYFSRHDNPSDVVAESHGVARALRDAGYTLARLSWGHLQVVLTPSDAEPSGGPQGGAARGRTSARDFTGSVALDVFTSFLVNGHLHQSFAVRAPFTLADVLPLGSIELQGRTYPAPANVPAWLAATYGPGWATPDPTFHFTIPPSTGRRLFNWIGDHNMHRDYWTRFYANRATSFVPDEPSSFARWVLPQLSQDVLVEIGSGTGRDGLWLAAQGKKVLGYDYAEPAVDMANAIAAERSLPAEFRVGNLYDVDDVAQVVGDVAAQHPDVYARFLLHSLEADGRKNLFALLAGLLGENGGRAYLEFRTDADAELPHVLEDHYRAYLPMSEVIALAEQAGLRSVYDLTGRGLAPYRDEDPVVGRLVLERA